MKIKYALSLFSCLAFAGITTAANAQMQMPGPGNTAACYEGFINYEIAQQFTVGSTGARSPVSDSCGIGRYSAAQNYCNAYSKCGRTVARVHSWHTTGSHQINTSVGPLTIYHCSAYIACIPAFTRF